jgi:hypothetical protein
MTKVTQLRQKYQLSKIIFNFSNSSNTKFRNSNYNSNNSNSYSNWSNKKNDSYKRERFNSDGSNPKISQNKFEEIEIDITNIKYSLSSK